MLGKVLINVTSTQVSSDLLSIFVAEGYEVFEARDANDLLFKYNLIREDLDLYIHELDEQDYEGSMAVFKKIDRHRTRTVLLIHLYSAKVIDDALSLSVKDVVVLPMERNALAKKLIQPIRNQVKTTLMPKMPPKAPEGASASTPPETSLEMPLDDDTLEMELNRAIRGRYPLSIVMVAYGGFTEGAFIRFEKNLRRSLRTTDAICRFGVATLLIVCPFTSKVHLAEVENKIRDAYKQVIAEGHGSGTMQLYGLTYPRDVASKDKLLEQLKAGIDSSDFIHEQQEFPFGGLSDDEVRKRLRQNY